ncbi:MAG: hypothetical protein GXZ11_08240 [Tissierellia bacterium]|nr:hypothetical protein [Tissierellia bacterium]
MITKLYKIIYDKTTGIIVTQIPFHQSYTVFFQEYPKDFVDSLLEIVIEDYLVDFQNYIVRNGMLVKLTDLERQELFQFKRILTNEERLLNELKPSPEEVKKAEQTIEILTLIQEVI